MANFVYTKFLERLATGNCNWAGVTLRCMLERSTSTYTPNVDHDLVSNLTNFVECSVSSYTRQTVGSCTVTADDTNNRLVLDSADVSFGTLETGQTVKAVVLFVRTGGSDVAANDFLVAYYDTATGLPATLGGGTFSVTLPTTGWITAASA